MSRKEIMLGNEAIARGLVEAGCEVAAAYPGTPSSEILPAVAHWADELGTRTVVEWGANEKVALEYAIGASFARKRSCAIMKQVGLNVAMDPFMSVAANELDGGVLLVVADEPGCYSSQTDQDSRALALFAKIPCFDPCDAAEAKAMVFDAYALSEKYKVLTMLRPTGRVNHCRQDIECGDSVHPGRPLEFNRMPEGHRILMPMTMRGALERHNRRFEEIRKAFSTAFEQYNFEVPPRDKARLGIIACGLCYAVVMDVLAAMGRTDVAVLKIGTPVPLPLELVQDFLARHDNVLLLEETFPVVEQQLLDRTRIKGRWNGWVPMEWELSPEVVGATIRQALNEGVPTPAWENTLEEARRELKLGKRGPRLCPGCGHRPSYFAIRKAYPQCILCSDIGCYGLAIAQKAVDTNVCMGGSITVASGIAMAFRAEGKPADRPIFATLGDSTFFHMGLPGLASAVYNKHPLVVVILDNGITAMTGGQGHPGVGGKPRRKDESSAVDLEDAVRGCGVNHVVVHEPYDMPGSVAVLREAWEYAKIHGEPAVVILRHPCITMLKAPPTPRPVRVDPEKCTGCRYCLTHFNCPGLAWDENTGKVFVEGRFCASCGVCVDVCPRGALVFCGEEA